MMSHSDAQVNQQHELIARGQVWMRFADDAHVRVMGVLDGYVVARIKGCMPWVMRAGDFIAKHRPGRTGHSPEYRHKKGHK